MSNQQFEDQHPRNRKGEFTDKPGTDAAATESDVALDAPAPALLDLEGDEVREDMADDPGETQIGWTARAQKTWRMPDGSFRRADIVYFPTCSASVPSWSRASSMEWEGYEIPLGRDMTLEEHQELAGVIRQLQDSKDTDDAPVFVYGVARQVEYIGFTSLDEPFGTATFHAFVEEGHYDSSFSTLGEAEVFARERADGEDWGSYRPEGFDQV